MENAQKMADEKKESEGAKRLCPACGAAVDGKFCPECGAKYEVATDWVCPACGTSCSGKFCPECGEKKPDGYACSCGYKSEAPFKFCPECGKKFGE